MLHLRYLRYTPENHLYPTKTREWSFPWWYINMDPSPACLKCTYNSEQNIFRKIRQNCHIILPPFFNTAVKALLAHQCDLGLIQQWLMGERGIFLGIFGNNWIFSHYSCPRLPQLFADLFIFRKAIGKFKFKRQVIIVWIGYLF